MDQSLINKHHAALLDYFAHDALVRCAGSTNQSEAMREEVHSMCYKARLSYDHVIAMVERQDFATLRAMLNLKEHTTSPSSAAGSSRSVFDLPDPKVAGTHSTPGTLSEPGRGSPQVHAKKAQMGLVCRLYSDGTIQRQMCFISPSNTYQSFASAGVLDLFSDKPFGDSCEPMTVPHLEGVGPVRCDRCITLTWCLSGQRKTHEDIFFIIENMTTAEIFTAAPPVGWNLHGSSDLS